MKLIPVVDLLGGQVVHARGGNRHLYQPVRSGLCESSTPKDVVRALLDLHPFRNLYVADLDAIQDNGNNHTIIASLATDFPELTLWVDQGLVAGPACLEWLAAFPGYLVLGSESQTGATIHKETFGRAGWERVVLSLDFRADHFLGPRQLLESHESWPQQVIVMSLARVGGKDGPDYVRLAQIINTTPNRQVFAAGGVRTTADIQKLRADGAAGVLLASSLHDGSIKKEGLTQVSDPQT